MNNSDMLFHLIIILFFNCQMEYPSASWRIRLVRQLADGYFNCFKFRTNKMQFIINYTSS